MSGGRVARLVLDRCTSVACVPVGGGRFLAPGPDQQLTVDLYAASTNGLGFVAVVEQSAPEGTTELYALACDSARCAHPALVNLGPGESTSAVGPGQSNVAAAATARGGFVVAVTAGEEPASGRNVTTVYECAQLPCRTLTQHQIPAGTSANSLALSVTSNDTVLLAEYVARVGDYKVVLSRCRSCTARGASFTTLDTPVTYRADYPGGPPPAIAFDGNELLIAYQNDAGSRVQVASCEPVSCHATAKTSLLASVHDLFGLRLAVLTGTPRVLWWTVGPASLSTYLLACARPLCVR